MSKNDKSTINKIDVILPTKNNARTIGKCLDNIKREIPVHCIINIDGYSTDGTFEFVKKVFPRVIQVRSNALIGKAREIGIELVDTDLFVFVDSDIYLKSNWLTFVLKELTEDTGAVEGSWGAPLRIEAYLEALSKFGHLIRWRTAFESAAERGGVARAFTGNTLIRTKLVRGMKIPNIPIYEDDYIRRHIEKQGARWVRTKEKVCYHDFKLDPEAGQMVVSGELAYQLGTVNLLQTSKAVVIAVPKWVLVGLLTKELSLLHYWISYQFHFFIGVLKAWMTLK